MSHWNVADVMTVGAVYVQRDTPFREIVDILELRRINAVPVVDDTGRVVGLVSSADLLTKIEFAGDDDRVRLFERRQTRQARTKSDATAAADLMTSPAVTVTGRTSVVNAAKRMDRDGLKRLPVVDDTGRPIGMVTRRDLLKVFLRPDAQIRCEIVDEVLDDLVGVDASQVAVEVDDGVVRLAGRLDRRSLVSVVIRQTERVDGVVDVISDLTYELDDTREQTAAFRPMTY